MSKLVGKITSGGQITARIVAAGPAGKSAYQYAVEGGYRGNENQFYSDLAGTGSGITGQTYTTVFAGEDFEAAGGKYRLVIPAERHQMGYRVIVKELLRQQEGEYGNVWYQYRTLPNGSVAITSGEAFPGKIIIEKI